MSPRRFKVGDHVTEQIDVDIWSRQTIVSVESETSDIDYRTVLGHLDTEEISQIHAEHTAPQLEDHIEAYDRDNPPWF